MKKIWLAWAVMMVAGFARAEIIYSNDFTGAFGLSPTNSAGIDPGISSTVVQTVLDGNGHLIPSAIQAGAGYRVQLAAAPITTNTVKLTFEMKTPTNSWIGIGFHGENINKLNEDPANSGPWLLVAPTSLRFKGGTGASNDMLLGTALFTAGSVNTFEMTYYTNNTVGVSLNGSLLANNIAVVHEFPSGTPSAPVIQYLQMQFFSTATDGGNYIDNVVVATTTDAPPPAVSSNLIYSNDFSGTEFKAAGVPAGVAGNMVQSGGRLITTNSNANTVGFRVDLSGLGLATNPAVSAVKLSISGKAPLTADGVSYLGLAFQNIANYNANSYGLPVIAINGSGLFRAAGGAGFATNILTSVSQGTNFTGGADFTMTLIYHKNGTIDTWYNNVQIHTNQAVTLSTAANFTAAVVAFRSLTTGGANLDSFSIETIPVAPVVYTLTVIGGSGSGSYTNGAQVAIAAAAPAPGLTFDVWTGDTQYVASVTSSNTTVTMSTNAVTLTATYKSAAVTLTASAGANGSVTPSSTNVVPGNSSDFVVTASNYYRIATLTTNGTAVTGMTFDNGSTTTNFTWSNVQAAGTVAATFTAQLATDPAGTPYEWLAGYGLTNYDTDAMADQDADGLKAWQEYIAGTDPTIKASCLKVAQTNRNTVTWSAVPGKVYSVYWSTNLVKGFTNLASGITYPQSSYTNTTPDAKVNHYQVRVQLP